MGFTGLTRFTATLLAIVVIVAIASFMGGMYLGLGGSRAPTQTVTVPRTYTYMQTVTQVATQAQISTQTTPTQLPTALPSKIVIGVPIQLTGPLAETSRNGLWGMLAAVKWVNEVYGGVHLYGRAIPLEIKYYDDESKRENTILYTERLITVDKVHFLIGAFSSALMFAMLPVTEKYKMIVVNWGAASDAMFNQSYKYLVSVLPLASKMHSPSLEAVASIDPNAKVAILYRDDEFGRLGYMGASIRAKELGLNVVYARTYPTDIKDFTPYITDLANVRPDVLLVVTSVTPEMNLLIKQLIDLGLNFKLIAGSVAVTLPTFYGTFGKLAEGISGPEPWIFGVRYTPDLAKKYGIEWFGPTTEEFTKFLIDVTGNPNITVIDTRVAAGAAAVLFLVKAIETAQSLDSTAVRDAFNKLYIMTFYGPLKIDPATGAQIGTPWILNQWQNGKLVVVWPPDVAQAKLYYPIPTWDEKRAGKVASQ